MVLIITQITKGTRGTAVYNGNLYVGTRNLSTGTEVWEYNGADWTQVGFSGFGDANNEGARVMAVYDGKLYVGTRNRTTGTEVWRCSLCDNSDWIQVNIDVFNDANNEASRSMSVYNGNLYVGTKNLITGAEVWKYSNVSANTPPVITYSSETGYANHGVNPDTGNPLTSFTFKAVYIDADNDAPNSPYLHIDGSATGVVMDHDTSASNPDLHDGNYTNGEQYTYETILPAGIHFYHFTASDGTDTTSIPASGTLAGPTVIGETTETPAGIDVPVTPIEGVAVDFTQVDTPGNTTVDENNTGTPPPYGFTLGSSPIWYDIITDAGFAGSVTVCINYDETQYSDENAIRLLHYEGGSWVDVTTFPVDTTHDIVCGDVTGFSEFALFESSGNQAPVADAGTGQTVHVETLVTLDGSGSSDPDENYPLNYKWNITSMPQLSTTTFSESESTTSTAVNPSFTPDMFGNYTLELVVRDSGGLYSAPVEVVISTYNTQPVAEAGLDQALIELGTEVQLGTDSEWQSYDPDGDTISYTWAIISTPEGSLADFSVPNSPTPTFVADVQGDYIVELVVSDTWDESDPNTMVVSFTNVKPVADAGGNKSAVVGASVFLDGIDSSDANGDPLTFSWSIVSQPAAATLIEDEETPSTASLTADAAGTYVISLVVHDGFIVSDPSNIDIEFITQQTCAIDALIDASDMINTLPLGSFKNKNLKHTLTNKINAVLKMIDNGQHTEAFDKLENDILGKTDGCGGSPDKNDFITTCEAQGQVYPLLIEAIECLN